MPENLPGRGVYCAAATPLNADLTPDLGGDKLVAVYRSRWADRIHLSRSFGGGASWSDPERWSVDLPGSLGDRLRRWPGPILRINALPTTGATASVIRHRIGAAAGDGSRAASAWKSTPAS